MSKHHKFVAEEREQILLFFSNPENWEKKRVWAFAEKLGISVSTLKLFMKNNHLSTIKVCLNCGKKFETYLVSPWYCSKECRFEYKHPMKKCVTCGRLYRAFSKMQKYCSPKCAPRVSSYKSVPMINMKCKKCDKVFLGRKNYKYCIDCSPSGLRKCPRCGKEFICRSQRKYCSNECAFPKEKPIPCITCGNIFVPDRDKKVFCGIKCRDTYWKKNGRIGKIPTLTRDFAVFILTFRDIDNDYYLKVRKMLPKKQQENIAKNLSRFINENI